MSREEVRKELKEIGEAISDWQLILEIETTAGDVEQVKSAKAHIAKLKARKSALKRRKEVPDGETWEEKFISAFFGG